ncbi:hypothetical protein E6C27_scaffold274G00320 [Cucumis melo var. makuwa]|uniref:Uncharacterized protein n=1 Tax=Cucumis melo var. makuwa TaxID=1194695 RepID=A0A5A7URK3_CUCMM|nr:hypothetical protein E6C27_scaffold274G00320 [Cucumis melo var. makuwa]
MRQLKKLNDLWCYFIKNKEERKGPQEINGGIDQAGCGKLQLSDMNVTDGERLPLAVKEMGTCDLYPQGVITKQMTAIEEMVASEYN